MNVGDFKKLPILGILRVREDVPVEDLVEAVISSGLKTIEITMNSFSAERIITRAVKAARGRLTIGAGTVMDLEDLKAARDCGSSFIVMPVLIKPVIDTCLKESIPVFPGALTPTEIVSAWEMGATMVKVFPSGLLGPGYFSEVLAPLGDVELMACGGVTESNIRDYFNSGARAVSFGSSIFRRDLISAGDFSAIERSIKGLIARSGFQPL